MNSLKHIIHKFKYQIYYYFDKKKPSRFLIRIYYYFDKKKASRFLIRITGYTFPAIPNERDAFNPQCQAVEL